MKRINKSKALRKRLVWVERHWDRFSFAAKKRLGLLGKPIIAPYRGFGDGERFWVRARVIEDKGIIHAPHTASLRKNIRRTIKRYRTNEFPGAEVAWSFGDKGGRATADEEGYVDFEFDPGEAIDAPSDDIEPLSAEVWVRTPAPDTRFGLISDIDDTIVETGAFDFATHWRTVVANSADSRVAFPDIAPLYQRIAKGNGGDETHPVFYVSSSPWNLFDLFERFMMINDIPVGPMMLKDFGMTETKWLTGGHQNHKGEMIATIMESFPQIRFFLAGDSGQHDARIYRQVIADHPDRVCGVLIRTVGPPGRHEQDLTALRGACEAAGIPFHNSERFDGAANMVRDVMAE
jgi:phosphatidate phosphatase APP1